MKKILQFIFLFGIFFILIVKNSEAATSVTQYGVTWTFNNDFVVGQFANEDYYVIDPGGGVNIVSITPMYAVDVNGREMNGSMINPPYNKQGYDSTRDYTASFNVAKEVSAENSLTINAGDSLVSSISVNPYPGENNSYLKTAAVLTCLSVVPEGGSFRPGYSDPEKTIYNKNDLNYSLLAKLPRVASTPSIQNWEPRFQRVWLDHLVNYSNRTLHPADNMQNYGRDLTAEVGTGALLLQLDYSDLEKEKLLINYVQVGIDLYSIIKAGGKKNWVNNGGHEAGRKWPILFAGIMLSDDGMKNVGQKSGDYLYLSGYGPQNAPADYIHFGEDDQTFYVSQLDIDTSNAPTWDPDVRGGEPYPYTDQMMHMPEWAILHTTSLANSNSAWRAIYRGVNDYSWPGFILAAHIMDAKKIWNHDALFDYMDRNMTIKKGDVDPFGYQVVGESIDVKGRSYSDFQEEMWDTYRANYAAVGASFPYRYDVNSSSITNTADALLTLRNSLELPMDNTGWRSQIMTGDSNCDGVSNSADALLILRYSLGLDMGETAWCEK